jgi:hypothetical protein
MIRHFLFFLLAPLLGLAQSPCSLELSKDSINVFTCPRADSRYKTIKSTFTIQSSLSQLAAAVLDVDNYGAWQYKTARVSILKKISERELVYYTEVEAPVLTSNRDFVIRLTVDPDPMTQGLIIEAVSLPNYIPPIEGVIRIPYSRARWVVVPAGKGKLAVEYTIDIDLGGSVPPWLVNLFAAKAPYETFKSLRELIGNYRGRQVNFMP